MPLTKLEVDVATGQVIESPLTANDMSQIALWSIPTPPPDPTGFVQAVKTALGGILAANTLMISYPAFIPAVNEGNWADLQLLIEDAVAKSIITQAQYLGIKSAASQFNIPVTLP